MRCVLLVEQYLGRDVLLTNISPKVARLRARQKLADKLARDCYAPPEPCVVPTLNIQTLCYDQAVARQHPNIFVLGAL
jgi:hypothetical protein